ncbi:MAG: hypothetical protein O7A69_14010 [SAR324 cluster bacterium]|nr:hypothetical protein [SAR324 cluster bacterium]
MTQPFLAPARLYAVSMDVPRLRLIVLPHPVADLAPEELREMARRAYPLIVKALTEPSQDSSDYFVDYVLPGKRTADTDCEICVE